MLGRIHAGSLIHARGSLLKIIVEQSFGNVEMFYNAKLNRFRVGSFFIVGAAATCREH